MPTFIFHNNPFFSSIPYKTFHLIFIYSSKNVDLLFNKQGIGIQLLYSNIFVIHFTLFMLTLSNNKMVPGSIVGSSLVFLSYGNPFHELSVYVLQWSLSFSGLCCVRRRPCTTLV